MWKKAPNVHMCNRSVVSNSKYNVFDQFIKKKQNFTVIDIEEEAENLDDKQKIDFDFTSTSNTSQVKNFLGTAAEVQQSKEDNGQDEVRILNRIGSADPGMHPIVASPVQAFKASKVPYFSSYSMMKTVSYSYLIPRVLKTNREIKPIQLERDSRAGLNHRFVDSLSDVVALAYGAIIRKWQTVQTANHLENTIHLRICSYNVLCHDTALRHPYMYKHLQGKIPEWNIRFNSLESEFRSIYADVFCLQEVQANHYFQFFLPSFKKMGYRGVYQKKSGRDSVDGCAIFYNNYFKMIKSIPIEYYVCDSSVSNKPNIGQIIRLKSKASGKEVCITNTHILFNSNRGDIKLAQIAILIANIYKECGPYSGRQCPFIMCGDFNIQPLSPIHNFLLNRIINLSKFHRNELSVRGKHGGPDIDIKQILFGTNVNRNCTFGDPCADKVWGHHLTHPLNIADAYMHVDEYGLPEVSTFTSIHAANPDFIFYSVNSLSTKNISEQFVSHEVEENSLHLMQRLSLPNLAVLQATSGPWPNAYIPSDHVPLIADFLLN